MRFLSIVLSIVFLTACSSISKEECQTGDWEGIGLKDGRSGYARTRLSDHYKACGEHGITPNKSVYLKGHKIGNREYCKPENGLELGLRKAHYRKVCSRSFEKKYYLGLEIAKTRDQIESIEDSILSKENQLETVSEPSMRKNIRNEIHSLKREKKQAKKRLGLLLVKSGKSMEAIIELL